MWFMVDSVHAPCEFRGVCGPCWEQGPPVPLAAAPPAVLGVSAAPFPGAFGGLISQPCPTLPNPMAGSPPGSSVPGILQARLLE